MNRNIKSKLTLWGIALTLLCITPICIIFAASQKQLLEERIKSEYTLNGAHKIDKVNRFLRERVRDLNFLLESDFMINANYTLEEKVEFLRSFAESNDAYATISFFDTKGIKIADTLDIGLNTDMSSVDFIQSGLSGKKYFGRLPEWSTNLKEPVLHFSGPIISDSGLVTNVLVLKVSLSRLHSFLEPVNERGYHPDKKVDLISQDGLVLFSKKDPDSVLKTTLKSGPLFQIIQQSRQLNGEALYQHNGKTYYGFFFKQPSFMPEINNGWYLVTRIERSKIFAPLWASILTVLASAILSIMIGIFLTLLLARRLSQNINTLREAVERFGNSKDVEDVHINSGD